MFLSLSCAVEGGSGVSRTRTREVPLEEGVCISGVVVVVCVCCFTYSRAQKGVCQMVRVKSMDSSHGCGQSSSPRYRCML